jgi:hypothetical protein
VATKGGMSKAKEKAIAVERMCFNVEMVTSVRRSFKHGKILIFIELLIPKC